MTWSPNLIVLEDVILRFFEEHKIEQPYPKLIEWCPLRHSRLCEVREALDECDFGEAHGGLDDCSTHFDV